MTEFSDFDARMAAMRKAAEDDLCRVASKVRKYPVTAEMRSWDPVADQAAREATIHQLETVLILGNAPALVYPGGPLGAARGMRPMMRPAARPMARPRPTRTVTDSTEVACKTCAPPPECPTCGRQKTALRQRREEVAESLKKDDGKVGRPRSYREELSYRRSLEQAEADARANGWVPGSDVRHVDLEWEGQPRISEEAPSGDVPAGWTVVHVHGSPTGFQSRGLPFGGTGMAQTRSVDEIAGLVAGGKGPVLLESCSTGKPIQFENPIAQQLADHPLLAGRPVVAPTRNIDYGRHIIGNEGRWFRFKQGGKWFKESMDEYIDRLFGNMDEPCPTCGASGGASEIPDGP